MGSGSSLGGGMDGVLTGWLRDLVVMEWLRGGKVRDGSFTDLRALNLFGRLKC